MKNIIFIIIATFCALTSNAQNNIATFYASTSNAQNNQMPPRVDERTELLGVVFRLAGAKEYVNNHIQGYASEIDTYFAPFKDHELIEWIPKLRSKYGISYDAVASFAIHITIVDGKIIFTENVAQNDLESRWTNKEAAVFLEKLNNFYTESKFNQFYTDHKPLYSIAEERFAKVLEGMDIGWFESYFGEKPNGKFNLVVSLTNGGSNYGSKVSYKDGTQDIYAIMGSYSIDDMGQPTYSRSVQSTVIHEYNHSFCNRLVDEYFPKMKPRADEFYNAFKEVLQKQAYAQSKTYLYEIMVRASVIEYYKKAGAKPRSINYMLGQEQVNGFIWIDTLSGSLDQYNAHRDKYPTLRSFMPEIVKLQNSLSVEDRVAAFDKKSIRIISSSMVDNATDVKPGLLALSVVFDKPMNTKSNGSSFGKRGKQYFPEFAQNKEAQWDMETKRKWTIYLDLKPDTEYSISFPSSFFIGETGDPVVGTYYLDFKTTK